MIEVNFVKENSMASVKNYITRLKKQFLAFDKFTRFSISTLFLIILIGPFAVMNIVTHAAGNPIRLEAESGSLSGLVGINTTLDPNASNQHFVQFGTTN